MKAWPCDFLENHRRDRKSECKLAGNIEYNKNKHPGQSRPKQIKHRERERANEGVAI